MWSKSIELFNPYEAIKTAITNNKTKQKKKFTPSITIWNLELCDKEDGTVLQNLYFLSYKRAKKFWEKHEAELEEYKVGLGGEPLWLW